MFSRIFKDKAIQLIKGKENIAQYVFSVAIVLELIVMMTDHLASWTLPYRGRVTHVAFVLFCVKILMTRYDLKQAGLAALAGMLGVISYCTCKDEYVIRAVIFVVAAIGTDAKRNLKIILWGASIGTAMIILLSLFGICGNVVDIRHYGRGMVEARYCLGFNHANNVHCMLWYMVSILIMIKHDKLKVLHYLSLFVINVGMYFFTFSRTGFLATSIILIMSILARIKTIRGLKQLYFVTAFLSLFSCIAVSVRAATVIPVYDKYQAKLNNLLTGRLEMIWEHEPMSTWVLFPGPRISEYVDNGFVSVTYIYGIIIGLLLCVLIAFEIYGAYKKDNIFLLIIVIGNIFVVFMESTFIFNVSLLCNMILILKMRLIGNE